MKKLGFGMMRLPQTDPKDWTKIDTEACREMIDRYLAAGFTYFDTAYVYHGGMSETIFGQLVAARYPRDKYILATKMPVFDIRSVEEYEKIFGEQLERCRVSYFDYYLLHCVGKSLYPRMEQQGAFAFLREKKAAGMIRHAGFSYHDDATTLDRILSDHPETEFVQLQLNYADWENEGIQSRMCYEVCVNHGKPVIVMEPLKGGALIDLPDKAGRLLNSVAPKDSFAKWGLRFAASPDAVFMVLSGMSDLAQLAENMAIMDDPLPLNEGEREAIREAAELINSRAAVPCTSCRYCLENCPCGIAIPEYFALYNNAKQFGKRAVHEVTFDNIAENKGKPSQCISCKKCEEHCPQHIAICNYLKDVAKMFECEHN